MLSIAVALAYYTGYGELFEQWSRIWNRDTNRGGIPTTFYIEEVGIVFGVLAIAGAWSVVRSFWVGVVYRVLTAWIAATALFVLLDLTTAVGIRYVLQAAPLIALLAALSLAELARRGRVGRVVTGIVLVYLAVEGFQNAKECLLIRYH